MDLGTPAVETFCTQMLLLVFIQRQPDKHACAGNLSFGGVEFISLCGPMPDNNGTGLDDDIVQHAHGIKEVIAVAKLIAQTEQGDGLAGKIDCGDIVPEFFPV